MSNERNEMPLDPFEPYLETTEPATGTDTQWNVFMEILAERKRQQDKWNEPPGVWPCDATTKLAVLAEEFGEVARGVLQRDAANVREELVQVAAVALKWLEAFSETEITNRPKDGTG